MGDRHGPEGVPISVMVGNCQPTCTKIAIGVMLCHHARCLPLTSDVMFFWAKPHRTSQVFVRIVYRQQVFSQRGRV